MQIVVVGTGYVGLVTGACLAEVGHEVTCVDVDERKIAMLSKGVSPIYEPGLDAVLERNIRHERLVFTTDLKSCLNRGEITFIAVGTPEKEDGSADLQHVKAVAASIGQNLDRDMVVVVKSTVPVGTCDIVEKTISDELKKRKKVCRIAVASNPEFLKEGVAVSDCMRPERIIVGINEPSYGQVFKDMYEIFIKDDPAKLILMDRRSSELTKYGSNAMLATRISFMNEMSRLCEAVGADVEMVRRGMGADSRIGRKFLYAGPGYGGSCFPKDVSALRITGESAGAPFTILDAVTAANEAQKGYVAKKIVDYFKGSLKGKKIAVWGLAFKPGTDDVREAPALTLIRTILDAGAEVVAHDPQALETFAASFGNRSGLTFRKEAYEAANGADALVLMTEWAEYRQPSWDKLARLLRDKVIFDFRNQYARANVEKLGFVYECVGRPATKHN